MSTEIPWADFLSRPEIKGMILRFEQPEGKRPIWGEVLSGRVLATGEVEFTMSWIASKDPAEPRVKRHKPKGPLVFSPKYKGPYYYPKGASFRMQDSRPGILHVIMPSLESRLVTTHPRRGSTRTRP